MAHLLAADLGKPNRLTAKVLLGLLLLAAVLLLLIAQAGAPPDSPVPPELISYVAT
jgi:hypothetical protein